jgi:hypothetical protein
VRGHWAEFAVALEPCSEATAQYTLSVATITEVEKLALDLPQNQRAVLATHLLRSLSPVLHDEDEGIAEAFLRDADLDTNPQLGMSLEQLDQQIERRRS